MNNRKTIVLFAIMATVTVSACAQQYDAEKDFEAYPNDDGKSVRIDDYLGSKWEIRIPPRIRNLPVTHIGYTAFAEKNLISVVIPNSVTHIDERAFRNNKLTSVIIGNSVTEIERYAFAGNQLTNVIIPNSVTVIDEAFVKNKLTSVTIGNSVTGFWAAFAFNQLTSVTIPNSVIIIGNLSFAFNKLTSVTIGNSVTEIGGWAFSYNQLTSVTIPDSVTMIGEGAFANPSIPHDVAAYIREMGLDRNQLMELGKNQLISVTIGNNVSIEDNAFNNNFETYYNDQGRKAGTYTLNNGAWSAVYR
jgi:predicted Kef-type K+ transport protein